MSRNIFKDIFGKLPERPVHLYAEPIFTECDGDATTGEVLLHTELASGTLSFPVRLDIPDGDKHPAIVRLARDGDGCVEVRRLCEEGYAVYTLVLGDIVSDGRTKRTDYERALAHRRSHALRRIALAAWAMTRVLEYTLAREDSSDVAIAYDCAMGGVCALLAAYSDKRFSYAMLDDGFNTEAAAAEPVTEHACEFSSVLGRKEGCTLGTLADHLGGRVCQRAEGRGLSELKSSGVAAPFT